MIGRMWAAAAALINFNCRLEIAVSADIRNRCTNCRDPLKVDGATPRVEIISSLSLYKQWYSFTGCNSLS